MSLILWSGGCDSSLLIFEQATKALAAGEPMPRTLSINYDEQINAGEQQRKVRAAFLKELARRGMKIEATELEIRKQGEGYVQRNGLPQSCFWLSLAQTFLEEEEDLYLGYVRGDDIWHRRSELIWIFDNTQTILRKTGKLFMPFEWVAKDEVLKDLAAARLDKLVWYCECVRPGEKKPCGWCPSCKSMSAAKHLAKRKWGYDKPPEPEKEDEPKKNSAARRRGQAQRKTPLSRGRRSRKAGETQKREAARPRRLR